MGVLMDFGGYVAALIERLGIAAMQESKVKE